MIKPIISMSIFLLASVTGEAMAACSTTDGSVRIADAGALESLLSGKTVCGQANGEEWQEYHNPNGALWDYKKGVADPVNPSEQVGTWDIASSLRNGASAIYSYDVNYAYKVWQRTDGKYDFCNGTQLKVAGAELRGGQVSCH
ncbi:conserved exported hypothetical protein [Crenothrix polyspora]|uniref:Secreted protein n=1 Tax=Crenothrix polyspora TaxID=360316 RepID=A0A1R4H886_9GAMM|nr:hypothetical protein [Crenothrix polyspora]SJM92462.1 conserved exported hypothetical protein [Crenothrix polyspora]